MIKIYGRSDDLIEIEGDILEEFNVCLTEEDYYRYLTLSNGIVIKVNYDNDGLWRLHPIKINSSYKKIFEAHYEKDDNNYSDIVEINDDITWVALSTEVYFKK